MGIDDVDCEDQALGATEHCTRCRTGFDDKGKPIYPKLELRGKFWCCPLCHGSYGMNPHPNCPPAPRSKDELLAAHGRPEDFAVAANEAFEQGFITYAEAQQAIAAYNKEFAEAPDE